MKASWLRYFGFLGFLGLLGLFTGNPGFYGLFNFFGLWGISGKKKSDELLKLNVARAGLNAFVVSLVGMCLTIAVLSFIKTMQAAAICVAAVFMAQLLTFIFSLNYFENRGNA